MIIMLMKCLQVKKKCLGVLLILLTLLVCQECPCNGSTDGKYCYDSFSQLCWSLVLGECPSFTIDCRTVNKNTPLEPLQPIFVFPTISSPVSQPLPEDDFGDSKPTLSKSQFPTNTLLRTSGTILNCGQRTSGVDLSNCGIGFASPQHLFVKNFQTFFSIGGRVLTERGTIKVASRFHIPFSDPDVLLMDEFGIVFSVDESSLLVSGENGKMTTIGLTTGPSNSPISLRRGSDNIFNGRVKAITTFKGLPSSRASGFDYNYLTRPIIANIDIKLRLMAKYFENDAVISNSGGHYIKLASWQKIYEIGVETQFHVSFNPTAAQSRLGLKAFSFGFNSIDNVDTPANLIGNDGKKEEVQWMKFTATCIYDSLVPNDPFLLSTSFQRNLGSAISNTPSNVQLPYSKYPWFRQERQLTIQPVRIRHNLPRTSADAFVERVYSGLGFDFMKSTMADLWGSVGVTFDILPPLTIFDDDFKIIGSTRERNTMFDRVNDPLSIEVFFVEKFARSNMWQGGYTSDCGSVDAKIMISDEQSWCKDGVEGVSKTRLAHHLGHAMGLLHSTTSTSSSVKLQKATSGTFMCPASWLQDPPRQIDLATATRIQNPLISFRWGWIPKDHSTGCEGSSCGRCVIKYRC